MIISLVMMINFTGSPDSIEVTELEFWWEHFCSCITIFFFPTSAASTQFYPNHPDPLSRPGRLRSSGQCIHMIVPCLRRLGCLGRSGRSLGKPVPSSSRRDSTSSWDSSSLSTPQNGEKTKQIASHEVRSPIKIHHYAWLICETRAKILLSDP